MSSTISQTGAASSISSPSNTAAITQVGPNANNAQMNQFLTLLVAQLQNQDPMQPTDPTQFVAQLAQFSTVEQLVQSNTTLSTIAQDQSGLALGQYTGMINHTVTASTTMVTVPASSGTPENLTYNVTGSGLTNVNIQVTNSSGTVVTSLPVTGGSGTIPFTGQDSKGNQLPSGQYSIALVGTSTASGTTGQTQSAGTLSSTGTVASVQQATNGGWQLQLSDGRLVTATSVTAVQ
jgi:flagellar basal-body rod modification protein FlgD